MRRVHRVVVSLLGTLGVGTMVWAAVQALATDWYPRWAAITAHAVLAVAGVVYVWAVMWLESKAASLVRVDQAVSEEEGRRVP